uniref:Reverse transcriptase domain-containing protein n=1 Tax=Cannabis sativa TaxID=3483 RepID=A0A803PDL7_CANSA
MASSSWNFSEIEEETFNLQVADENDDSLRVGGLEEDDGIDPRWCLVGRFLSTRMVDFDIMQNNLAALWQPEMGMFVKLLQPNLYLFQFYHEVDIQRVMEGSPWTFNRMQLIFERLQEGVEPRSLVLNKLDMWIQIWDVRPGCMTATFVENIGNILGSFVETDPKNFIGVWRDYLRVRVTFNIDKPLRRRLQCTKTDGTVFWVSFKYERVPTFCYICGLIGHSERFCRRLYHEPIETITKPYGELMRAKFQKHNQNIGSRWLRTKGWRPEAVNIGGGGERGQPSTPNMETSQSNNLANNSSNQSHIPVLIAQAGRGKGIQNELTPTHKQIVGNKEQDFHVILEGEDSGALIVSDQKKRKMEGGPWRWGSPIIMNILSWNCRGLGPPWTIQFLKDLVGQKKPMIVFLCETLCDKKKVEIVSRQLGFEGCYVVEAQGRSGGISLLWQNSNDVKINSFSKNHIDCVVSLNGLANFRLTGMYGEPNRTQRRQTWDLIRTLKEESTDPWVLTGDFNNVLSQADKKGGRPYPSWLIDGFHETLQACNLCDLEMRGHPYTWEKSRGTDRWIEARLDRAIASQLWLDLFPLAILHNLEVSTSDHSPLLLDIQPQKLGVMPRKFRFENFWLGNPDCEQIITENWGADVNVDIQRKIKVCGEALFAWGNTGIGNFSAQLKDCNKRLKSLKRRRDAEGTRLYKENRQQLFDILHKKEIFWRQRSKQLWLQAGDKNSKYFHASASKRRRNNQLSSLKDDNGNLVSWDNGLDKVVIKYFEDLFLAGSSDWEDVLQCVDSSISTQQNEDLLRPISETEVKTALFQMHPDKSPGPDGMNPAFYQKYWHIVGHDVVVSVQKFFCSCSMPVGLNDTNVVLIPKKKNPDRMSDLRPISLCNVLSKVMTKVLANRMKHLLDQVISMNQSAFIPGRLITDNIMIAFEVLHYLKRKQSGRDGYMALKLDLSKAYDRVEWPFLLAIMNKMGFHHTWINLIQQCLSTVRYNVVSGGFNLGPIVPSRGIRQGDPISPYLFLICAEGLSAIIRRFEEKKCLHGCRVANRAPIISHLLFADDSYIYCKATNREADEVLRLLALFEKASGQQVNYAKSSVFFSTNTTPQGRDVICSRMGIQPASDNSKYLGLPSIMNRNKNVVLGYLKDKVRQRIQSWDNKFLSRAGKEVLIKSVLQSLPSYAMNVFLLRRRFVRILSMMRKFGGDLSWRLLVKEESLVAKVFKARYYPNGNYLHRNWTAAIPRVASAATSFAGWFDDGLKLWTKEDRTGAAMLCWSIWNNCNNSVWNSKQSSVEEVVSIASLNFVSWNNAQNQSHISPSGHGQQGRYFEHWTRPIDPYIKVNVDGAIFSNEECFGFGMVARTASGSVIEALQIRKIGNWSPLLVEVMGLKEALSWIKQKDWHSVIVESDCLTLINDVKSTKTLVSPYGFVLQDCRGLLTSLVDVDCKFVKRSANSLAHALARASLFEADRILSGDSSPTCYASIVLGDLN